MKKYIGCDLGGTNLRAGVVDPTNGKILADRSTPALAREGHIRNELRPPMTRASASRVAQISASCAGLA